MEDESEEQDVRRSKRAKAFDGQPINITDASESDHELEANRRRKAAKASVYEEQNIVNQKRGKAFHGQPSDGFQSDVADHELEVNPLQKLNRKAGVGFDDEDMFDDKIADESMADPDDNNDNQKRGKAFQGQPSDGFQSDVDDHESEVNRLQNLNHKASVGFGDEDMLDDKIADELMADTDHNNDNQHSLVSVQQEHPEMEAEAEASSMDDLISTLPSTIIDTILCFVPIKNAVRTSTLSRNWKYNWVTIPKLVFHWRDMLNKTTCELLDVIHQVLPLHQGPILEFSLTTRSAVEISEELDEIVSHLVRNNNTLKKVTLNLNESDPDSDAPLYVLPLSFFSLHQLTDLYLKNCTFTYNRTHSGFPCLTSLFLESNNMITISKKALLCFLSNCPRLKQLEMVLGGEGTDEAITLTEISKCLPVIEHLSSNRWTFQRSEQSSLRRKLPIALVHLKYLCLNMTNLFDDDGFRFLGLVIKNSPNLEKIKLEIADDDFGEDDIQLVTMRDCADIWLEHLKELEIVDFSNMEAEMEFVKLILAKSPVLKNVNIAVHGYMPENIELEVLSILLNSPRASPLVKIIVERRPHSY